MERCDGAWQQRRAHALSAAAGKHISEHDAAALTSVILINVLSKRRRNRGRIHMMEKRCGRGGTLRSCQLVRWSKLEH